MKTTVVHRVSKDQIDLRTAGSTVHLRGSARIFDRHDSGLQVRCVLGSNDHAARCIFVDSSDQVSLATLDTLPVVNDPDLVGQVLARIEVQVKAEETKEAEEFAQIPATTGYVRLQDSVVTVVAGDKRDDFALGYGALPHVKSIAKVTGGGHEILLVYPDKKMVKIQVPENNVDSLLRAMAVLRPPPVAARVETEFGDTKTERWQYQVIRNMTANRLEASLNELGRNGWELVAIAGLDGVLTVTGNKLYAVLKRSI